MTRQQTSELALELRRSSALSELLQSLATAKTAEEICQAAVQSLVSAMEANGAAILSFGDDGAPQVQDWRGVSGACREAVARHVPWRQGAHNSKPVFIREVASDEGLADCQEALEREQIRALAFIPMSLDTGVLGAFLLHYKDRHEFTEDEIRATQAIATPVALALERRRVADALARAERHDLAGHESLHLAAIVESSDDAIVSKDLNGIIKSWNRGAERVFGYAAHEAIGRPITILAPVGGMEDMRGILTKVRQGQRIDHYETIRRRKDGQTINVSLTVSPIRDASGRIIGASKIARDITARKVAEREHALLLEREQDARRTAELLNRVGSILAAELDTEKLVQAVTNVARELVGAEFGWFVHNAIDEQGESCVLYTVSGGPWEAFKDFPVPRKAEIFGPAFRQAGVVRSDDVSQDSRYGESAPYIGPLPIRSYLAVPVTSRSGEVLGGLFFGHSMPARFTVQQEAVLLGLAAQAAIAMDNARLFEQAQWAQEELKRSNEELRRANQDLESFAYSASHDLQEPLRTMAVSSQLLQRRYGGELQEDARQILGYIVEGARRMEALILDILAYATAAKYAEGPSPLVDSAQALGTALANLKGPIEDSDATIAFEPLPSVFVHENHLVQLFQNLIGNAIKYRRREAPRVYISAIERDGWTVFSVVDNGIGIEQKFADYIFGLFKRLHGRQEHPGSGIGLAICQRIVEQYGGRIWLERSVPGEGSTFCFTFPTRA